MKIAIENPEKTNLNLEEKEIFANKVVAEALSKAKNPFAVFTGGKDSLVVLHLIRQSQGGKIEIPILHIDTSVQFEEVYNYIEKMRTLWQFTLIRERNKGALKTIKIAEKREECCNLLRTEALNMAIKKHNIDYLFTTIRDDKQKSCSNGAFISKRNDHIRVRPIHPFTEKEVWDYVKKHNLPYCSLYDKGYRGIGCKPCTKPAEGEKERSGRSQKNEGIMKKLRALGYF